MMVRHKIGGIYVNPMNPERIAIQINHDQESIINQGLPFVGVSNLYLAREDRRVIMDRLNQPPGITEGIPYDIEIIERGITQVINMYVDCMAGGFATSRDGVNVGIKMLASRDNINDRADSFTHEGMYNETGVIPFTIDGITYPSYQNFFDRKTIYVPYIISTIPNYHDAFLAIFGITFVATELYRTIKDIIHWLTPSVGAVGPVVHIFQLVAEVVFAAILLATLIGLVTQLINCLIQPVKYHGAMLMSDLLKVTAVKLGLTVQSSIWDSYPYNQIAYLPEKYNPVEGNGANFSIMGYDIGGFGTKGYTSPGVAGSGIHDSQTTGIQHGYYNGTGGDFLRLIKSFCNGKIIIPDATNNLVLERRDYFPPNTPYQLPDVRQDWNGYNTDELLATIILKFQSDLNDRNCIDFKDASGNPFYPGTILQATHQQVTTVNQLMVCLKGLREIQIAAARGARKDQLTFIEKAVNSLETIWTDVVNTNIYIINNTLIPALNFAIGFINVIIGILNAIIAAIVDVINVVIAIVDAITALFGGSGPDELNVDDFQIPQIPSIPAINFLPLSNDLGNRIGALLLENDMVDTPKLLLVDTTRSEFTSSRIAYLHPDNASTINAKYLWDKFYFIDAFVNPADPSDKANRFTKITPELNHVGDKNRHTLSLRDFINLVSNPQFLDNFGEKVIADSVQWFPDSNGVAEFSFRKPGWLNDPQNPITAKRAQEIAINLNLKISIPNGQ